MLALRHPNDLSKRAKEVLAIMAANEHHVDGELVAEGIEAWVGDQRTSRSVMDQLLSCCFISGEASHNFHRYTINESGKRFLKGEKPYMDSEGNWHDSLFTMIR